MSRVMTTIEKCDLVLDAYSKGAVTETELEWLIPLVLKEGDKLSRERIIQLIVGDEAEES